jgi:hypothetical protein
MLKVAGDIGYETVLTIMKLAEDDEKNHFHLVTTFLLLFFVF